MSAPTSPTLADLWNRVLRFFVVVSDSPQVEAERSKAIAERARIANWIAIFVIAVTVLGFNYAFHPDKLGAGVLLVIGADASILLMLFAARRGWFAKRPDLQFLLLLGVICNATEVAQLVLTGGPIDSFFLFPYFLVYFGMAILLPSRLGTVFFISVSLPIGYFVSGIISGVDIANRAFLSNLFLLFDYTIIALVANRLMTSIFVREVRSRLDLEEANERLRELDRLKSELFANVSHEMRTPLTLILGPATSLGEEDTGLLNAEQRNLVDGIQRNSVRLLTLINDFLLQASLDSGQMIRRRQPVDVRKVVKHVYQALAGQARTLGLQLEIDLEGDLGEWYGDRGHLERILINLASNACKFTEAGGKIRISASRSKDEFVLSVTDTGIGIARENVGKLFDRFVQVESAANRRFEGTGIGLSIVKELAEFHDGSVSVTSELGRGSRFTVRLPAGSAKDTAAGSEYEVESQKHNIAQVISAIARAEAGELPSRAQGPHVVVIEDNPDLLSYLRQELARSYRVHAFKEATSALEHIESKGCDLILSDIMLPVVDGIELARRVRARMDMQEIPILLMSARDDMETKLKGFAAGVDDFVPKPFHLPELRARIRAHLRIRSQAQELETTVENLRSAMEQLKQAEATLLHTEKMALLGRVVAGVAHEVNNPLHFLKGNLSLLRTTMQNGNAEQVASMIDDLEESTNRIEAITRQLTHYGRSDSDAEAEVELRPLMDTVVKMLKARAGEGVRFEIDLDAEDVVFTSPQAMFQIALNVVHNAIQAVDPKTGVVRVESRAANGTTEIRFTDNGPGISDEVLPHVFEPFYTTKTPGEGTGLGLAIVQNLATSHNGEIELQSEPGKGTTVSIRFPRGVQ